MRVMLNETHEIKVLMLKDPKSGMNLFTDFISEQPAMFDGSFEFDDDQGLHKCSQGTYDFWRQHADLYSRMLLRKSELERQFGASKVDRVIRKLGECELLKQAELYMAAFDREFN